MKKKFTLFLLTAAVALLAVPAASGCDRAQLRFTLSEEGSKHYSVKCGDPYSMGECEIPSYYGEGESYAPVTVIEEQGFMSCHFSSITIPATVTEIGIAAFSFCSSLKSVEFTEGSTLTKISQGVFGECPSLSSVNVPKTVTEIGPLAFKSCSSLMGIDIENVQTISLRAFESCSSLENVTFTNALTTIGDLAFFGTGLKEVVIPPSVRDLEKDGKTVAGLGIAAFLNCGNLETVKILGNISVIPSGAFGACLKLTEIHLPLSVKEIKGAFYGADGSFYFGHAFYADDKLTDVYYEGTEEQWKDIKIDTKSVYENKVTMNNKAIVDAAKHYNS